MNVFTIQCNNYACRVCVSLAVCVNVNLLHAMVVVAFTLCQDLCSTFKMIDDRINWIISNEPYDCCLFNLLVKQLFNS